jgi:hypothetical protein
MPLRYRRGYAAGFHRGQLVEVPRCAAILSLGVSAATHGTPEGNAWWHGWLTVGVASKINQASPQGIKET